MEGKKYPKHRTNPNKTIQKIVIITAKQNIPSGAMFSKGGEKKTPKDQSRVVNRP
jgi:hypothetical protein